MAAGLLGYSPRIRVGPVAAGLRTGDKWQPFPEEINRKIDFPPVFDLQYDIQLQAAVKFVKDAL